MIIIIIIIIIIILIIIIIIITQKREVQHTANEASIPAEKKNKPYTQWWWDGFVKSIFLAVKISVGMLMRQANKAKLSYFIAFPLLQLRDSHETLTIDDYILKLLVGTNSFRIIYSLITA